MAALQTRILKNKITRWDFFLPGFFALAITMLPALVAAQPNIWLPPGSTTEPSSSSPPEILNTNTKLNGRTLLGRLLFNSPTLLGEKAVRIGLSCNSCHPNGHVNTSFYISGLSSDPGTIDLTNDFWNAGQEDTIFNPIPIPSLRGVSKTAPYGRVLNLPSLAAFTSHVMIDEFGATPPKKTVLDALIDYMNQLETEQFAYKYIHVNPPQFSDLLDLLATPLRHQDISEFEFRADLIKEELGRQVTKENRAKLTEAAQSFRKIAQKMTKDPIIANRAFIELKDLFLEE
ncbi:MAG: hypothetical protein V7750_02730 [Sneathiella sp.]